jgi:hypothetical protein
METNLYLQRIIFTDVSTIGDLTWQGGEFQCSILEDTCRHRDINNNQKLEANEKVYGKTAIPAGRYEIKMQWSQHFQRKMPFLQNVPLFSGAMIHWGNKPADTFGCLLVGAKTDQPDWISESQKSYNELEPKILDALSKGPLYINITGGYSA